MSVGIIDADLIGRKNHRFPNLACMKISAYWKEQDEEVTLMLDYDHLDDYDRVYISRVFTDTYVPETLVETERIHLGGTGFFFDKAPNLPDEIEHHMPDYSLYDDWIELQRTKEKAARGEKFNEASFHQKYCEYLDYSIGFLTRGCFRKCGFCVNRKYDHVFAHSALNEFYDESRKKICLLDDNFFGYPHWRAMLEELRATGKPFKFKQGLDERLLNDERCELLFSSKYDMDFVFAFDKIQDYDLIHEKLKLIRKYTDAKHIKFYVLCGFDSTDETDIENVFKRIALLMKYQCIPYIMKFRDHHDFPYERSEYRGMYIELGRWCNQPSLFKKMSFREYCERNQYFAIRKDRLCAPMKYMTEFEKKNPEIARKYFDMKFSEPDKIIL